VLDGQRALLLMDNAANAEQVEPLIPPIGCLLLVTSRQHFTVPGLAAKNLDTLSAADARNLLLTIAPRIETQADEIATLCGHLPLALRLAAAAIVKYRNLSSADYVRRLRDRQQRLQLIDASLSLSYELLSEELRERWRWLAVFPDTFASDAAAAVWEVELDKAKYKLGELMASSLVEWNETSGRYRLHDLARLFADAKFNAEERAVSQKRFAMHYKNVLAAANGQYLRGGESLLGGLALFDLEWGNIQEGHAWVSAQVDAADADVTRLGMTYPEAGVYVLDLRKHPRELIRWLELALAAARQLKHREYEGASLGNLGNAYADLGETRRAIQFFEQHLTIARELGNRRSEGTALGNLGLAFTELGDTRRAIQF
jgi:tetratricopeptide (TPR) repeat protein